LYDGKFNSESHKGFKGVIGYEVLGNIQIHATVDIFHLIFKIDVLDRLKCIDQSKEPLITYLNLAEIKLKQWDINIFIV